MKGNTVGSRSSTELAYIAGFLDGDGSLMLQIKKRSDTKRGYRFMATICFYQDTRHESPLHWMQSVLGVGYISQRNDGISELRINGFKTIEQILDKLEPHVRFKAKQTAALKQACNILQRDIAKLNQHQLRQVVDLILIIQNENYTARRKKSEQEMHKLLGLTP